jgi:uncharacterized protein YrrD
MLRSARGLLGRSVEAADGRLGRVSDLCVDDSAWVVRHVVASTGRWPARRKVALPVASVSVTTPDGVAAAMNREAALDLREVPRCVPGHRRRRIELSRLRHWLTRWPPPVPGPHVAEAAALPRARETLVLEDQNVAPHLRSFNDLLGRRVQEADRRLGRVDDLIVDIDGWSVPHLVVRPGWWRRGEPVHVPAERVESLDDGSVEVRLGG